MRTLLEFFEIVSTVTFVSGFLLNLLLLYLIRRFSTKELGTYKNLLGIFVAYDTYLVVVHHVINPKVIPSRTGFGIVSDRGFGVLAMVCFYSSCYAAPFVLLNIHLLYRYWIIQDPSKIALFSKAKFVISLALTLIVLQFNWFLSCYYLGRPEDGEENARYQALFLQEYEKDTNEGALILNYWREGQLSIRPLLFLVVADSVEIVTVCVATTIATLTFRKIREAKHISETIRAFQLRILLAASAQTLTPVLFVYTPYFFNVTLPLFHVYSPPFSALSMVLLSCFPVIDAVVIIGLMKPYRQGLLTLLGQSKKRETVAVAPLAFTVETGTTHTDVE